ncbi:uncharacterized protein LOC129618575 [Condylostylus longicornis]|uniref:uncharacterized protein LOC129618575 n=1 Tax=Condylostylus longicornis TaxID=2530218 RepID=UPI00244DFD2F|nr:uncharacterized protein LOC129618575 [Condylostylus longicornis]
MARQRKNATSPNNPNNNEKDKKKVRMNNNTSSSSTGSQTPVKPSISNNKYFFYNRWWTIFGSLALLIASVFCYLGYLETRVNTPFDNQKMVERTGLEDLEKYWGSYRPGQYFGLKTRDPYSLVMGLMWYFPYRLKPGGEGIRHWCEIGDKLQQYGWTRHDGRSFGLQEIHDSNIVLETSFIKIPGKQYGGDWSARIAVKNKNPEIKDPISLIWYVALDEKTNGHIWQDVSSEIPEISGETTGLGEFKLTLNTISGKVLHKSFLSTVAPSLQHLTETIKSFLRLTNSESGKKVISLAGESLIGQNGEKLKSNFIAIQLLVNTPFTLDISYNSVTGFYGNEPIPHPPIGEDYTQLLKKKIDEFDNKFEKTFNLENKKFSQDEINFAKAALSNMLGGIGYFYGSSRVKSVHTKEPVPYWKAPLYTAVPSRSFFPRGFLWDEGFHGLLISEWDLDIELDILCHWFDLINVEGWIPREQILGVEALAKVPEEFVTQRNTNANPPTFFMVLKKILTKHRVELSTKKRISTLERLYPRLQAWFTWYNTTQKGEIIGTYRWHGRDENSIKELNPKTLTSGLDDYPRASHPTDKERHVDLRCWITLAAGVMAELSSIIGRDDIKYWETYSYLSDNTLLNEMHLSPYTETYSDFGLHTDAVSLKRPQPTPEQLQHYQQPEMIREVTKQPEYRYVDSTFGYVSLFPFILEILDPNSAYLHKILKDMRDPTKLWTDFGIRSLSKTSPLYMKWNTEHDPPYWRGQIWININYLALKALYHYGSQPGPYSEESKKIYVELRQNIINNIFKEYKRTGYIWEQYNDKTGEGSGCHPFTGWSALVVMIMSEQY